MLKVYSDVVNAIDGGDVVLLGMLDLSAAFDTVDHDILLERLCRTHGIEDKALFWIQLYLSNRSPLVTPEAARTERLVC